MYALHLDAGQIAIRVLLRVDFHVARAAVDRDLDLLGGAIEVGRLVRVLVSLAEPRVHDHLTQASGSVNPGGDAARDAHDYVARARLGSHAEVSRVLR